MKQEQECCQEVSGGYLGTTCPKCNKPFRSVIQEPKQETLEEACKRIKNELDYSEFDYTSFKLGVKWQQEQDKNKYSEEEVEVLIKTTYEETMRAMVDWFVNNKDKNQEEMESAIENYVYPRLAEKGIKFKNK
jgi:hypothetical protein